VQVFFPSAVGKFCKIFRYLQRAECEWRQGGRPHEITTEMVIFLQLITISSVPHFDQQKKILALSNFASQFSNQLFHFPINASITDSL